MTLRPAQPHRFTLPAALVMFAGLACLLDAFTTWVALTGDGGFHEYSSTTAALIRALGLAGGLTISVLLRVAVFAAVAVGMERLPRLSLPLFGIGLLAAGATWLIVLGNIAALAAS